MRRLAQRRAGSRYDPRFFDWMIGGATRSAAIVVPVLIELTRPCSVVDVGCGSGAWLREFQQHGVETICGIDGGYMRREDLVMSAEHFRAANLARPFTLPETFDLAICLEVAEHLPPARAAGFVDDLIHLAPIITFSAAIPHQGGTRHVHERWQSYWASLFHERGYMALDCLRDRIWTNDAVDPWYAQNLLLYVRADRLDQWDVASMVTPVDNLASLDRVHPRIYTERVVETANPRRIARGLPGALGRAARRRLWRPELPR